MGLMQIKLNDFLDKNMDFLELIAKNNSYNII